ncbi:MULTISPECIES: Gfo/Idh/MocA family protein [Tenebrionibacter/Tenebrionicola group]|uniref:Gfo/Idh/MocA family oxidoreductase n=2 Tax=Tenebrionibacter/Tenebrionicola group TaxID=2969848 RepID=A0A8K0V3D9_9ENTR|nr:MULTISPECIES: Gfo/Idh/MocA family oxidoreductase [Tenebrionibacter/Tenebrionicola group]MBK4716362.1 Gfo/Idh/MocA family oxidoreductase [Tenebrionibacter intestinalis]MBV5097139.1 Gfo/Idh/MocA family oxidoreductase [Tenebrionicola larvae]
MATLRIGMVGLGAIARKAWLPVLSVASEWTLAGAFSPSREKAAPVCAMYRIPYFASLDALAACCDAVFVHSATQSHYEVVSKLLRAGVHVCVDKPLAMRLSDAERLVALAARRNLTLMVAFNRRFAPLYRKLSAHMETAASLRMDKHRLDSVGPGDLHFTLLDDYLHVIDTALWLAGGEARLESGGIHTNDRGQMLYAGHRFRRGGLQITTAMHRRAGSQREWLYAVTDGALFEVTDMREWREERGAGRLAPAISGWQSTLEQRGFTGCARHFIDCVMNQTAPETSGDEALRAQRVVEALWRETVNE